MKKLKRLNLILGAIVILGIAWPVSSWFAVTDFPLRRGRYENIILQVKAVKMKVGDQRSWHAELTRRPTLSVLPTVGWHSREGEVEACRTSKGYIVSIITSDKGHFGMSGYLFSDVPVVMTNDTGSGKTVAETPTTWFVNQKINARWWAVYNNLN